MTLTEIKRNLKEIRQKKREIKDLKKSAPENIEWHCPTWRYISQLTCLSEEFIEKNKRKVFWYMIGKHQNLSEEFIEKFSDKLDWSEISACQNLSEEFIERNKDRVDWDNISTYQKLSEEFIKRNADYVNWKLVSKYQYLTEDFIAQNRNKLYTDLLADNWTYRSVQEKKAAIMESGLYECHEDFFYAYKCIRNDRYSMHTFRFRYLPGKTYETFASGASDSGEIGFSAYAKKYAPELTFTPGIKSGLVVKVKVYYKDVAGIYCNPQRNCEWVRCSKLIVMD